MTETFDALLMPYDDPMKRSGSGTPSPSVPTIPTFNSTLGEWSSGTTMALLGHTTALSPPPTPRTTSPPGCVPVSSIVSKHRPEKLSLRLRSNSGLALHTNQAALRQYTEYDRDGSMRSPRSPTFTLGPGLLSPDVTMLSIDAVSAAAKRSSGGYFPDMAPPILPILDLFHRDIIQVILHTPSTAQRLCKFAQWKHRGGNMEFLLKIEEYSSALKNFTSILNSISKTFTSSTAASPLGLPHELSNNINVHMKHFARSMLPLLDKLFRDAKLAVEDRIAKDVYPEFLKYQFAQCMGSSLSLSRSQTGGFKSAYPGLGDAFCLTDTTRTGSQLIYASDGLVQLSGYGRVELMQKNWRLMQGLSTDGETMRRIKEAVELGREASELILNYRKDGTAFWNLLYICPLVERGQVRYFLGAQINVSENMGTHYKDILRILNFGPSLGDTPVPEKPTAAESADNTDRASARIGSPDERMEETSSAKSSKDDPRRRSERRFFKFTRKSNTSATSLSRPDTARESLNHKDDAASATSAASSTLQQVTSTTKRSSSSRRPTHTSPAPEVAHTPYTHFFVLRYVPASARVTASGRPESLRSKGGGRSMRLPVSFCSAAALELLGLEAHEIDFVLARDIFSVLVDRAGSPTVSRTVKNDVRGRLSAGESVSVDIMVQSEPRLAATRRAKKTSVLGLSSRNRDTAGLGGGSPPGSTETGSALGSSTGTASSTVSRDSEPALRPRKSETFDRGAEALGSVFFGPKMRRMVSHWAPLKDFEGNVGFVVLIMTPVAS